MCDGVLIRVRENQQRELMVCFESLDAADNTGHTLKSAESYLNLHTVR